MVISPRSTPNVVNVVRRAMPVITPGSAIDILLAAHRNLGDHLFGGRVDDVGGRAVARVGPFAVNEHPIRHQC